jgi:hypothetical protein
LVPRASPSRMTSSSKLLSHCESVATFCDKHHESWTFAEARAFAPFVQGVVHFGLAQTHAFGTGRGEQQRLPVRSQANSRKRGAQTRVQGASSSETHTTWPSLCRSDMCMLVCVCTHACVCMHAFVCTHVYECIRVHAPNRQKKLHTTPPGGRRITP